MEIAREAAMKAVEVNVENNKVVVKEMKKLAEEKIKEKEVIVQEEIEKK